MNKTTLIPFLLVVIIPFTFPHLVFGNINPTHPNIDSCLNVHLSKNISPINLNKFSIRLIGACRGKKRIKLGELTIKYRGKTLVSKEIGSVRAINKWQNAGSYGVSIGSVKAKIILQARITGRRRDKKKFYARLKIKAPFIDKNTDRITMRERCEA